MTGGMDEYYEMELGIVNEELDRVYKLANESEDKDIRFTYSYLYLYIHKLKDEIIDRYDYYKRTGKIKRAGIFQRIKYKCHYLKNVFGKKE